MIHGVFEGRIGQFTALRSGTIGFVHLGQVAFIASKCHDVAVEAVDELFEATHRVTLGIDGDKQHGHLVLLGAQAVAQDLHIRQGGRTDIGAIGIPKKDHHHLAPLATELEGLVVLVG